MKKLIPTLIIIIVFLTFRFCSNSSQSISGNKIIQVEIENCRVSVDLKLSDLIDSCWLVQLETTNESMLGNFFNYVYVGDNYILIDDRNGIFKFSADGKFIKKILNVGRAPNELSVSPMYSYCEKRNLLYISDHLGQKGYIQCYNVASESFLPPIKKCFQGACQDFAIYDDSLIMASPSIDNPDSNPYGVFFQDLKGNFVSGIKSNRKFVHFKGQKELLQRIFIFTGDQVVHVKYCFDDTLFSLNRNNLSPYLVLHYKTPRIEPPQFLIKPNIGDKFSTFDRLENPGYLIFRNQTFKGEIPYKNGSKADYKSDYFFINKSSGKYGIIKSYIDDFTGKIQSFKDETITFPSLLPNDKLYVVYFANELLKQKSIDVPAINFPKSLNDQLSKIKNNLKETDNPILLIGVPKKRIGKLQ